MKKYDEIERIKDNALHIHRLEDGILDMTMGMILCMISVGTRMNNPGLLWIFIFAYAMITKALKKKYVYPRVGIAIFTDTSQHREKLKTGIIPIFLIMGLLSYMLLGTAGRNVSLMHPWIIIIGILISGMYILGGVSQKHIFYLIGLALAVPVAGIQFSKGVWLGMCIINAILLILLALLFWMAIKGKPAADKYAVHRPSLVIHSLMMIGGLLCFIYFILLVYAPKLALQVRTWGFAHQSLIFGNIMAMIILLIGIIYKEARYYLYALLLCTVVCSAKLLIVKTISLQASIFSVGVLILIIGFVLLISFTFRYPILKEKKGEQGED